MAGTRWTYTEDAILKQHYATMPMPELLNLLPKRTEKSIWSRAKELKIKRGKALLIQYAKAVQQHPNVIKSRFQKGLQPWNTNKKGVVGLHPNTAKNHFKKGQLPHNTLTDGAISCRADKNGCNYKFIRIGLANWQPYHRYIWIQHNGPIPEGYIVRFINGNTLDCRIENLELIPRALHSIMNKFGVPRELAEVINLTTQIKQKIKEYEKQN